MLLTLRKWVREWLYCLVVLQNIENVWRRLVFSKTLRTVLVVDDAQ